MSAMSDKLKLRRKRSNVHQAERRRTDPEYREQYNALRADYYHRTKDLPEVQARLQVQRDRSNMKKYGIRLDNAQLRQIRDEVFGHGTLIGEFSVAAMRRDLREWLEARDPYLHLFTLRQWLLSRLKAEEQAVLDRPARDELRLQVKVSIRKFLDEVRAKRNLGTRHPK